MGGVSSNLNTNYIVQKAIKNISSNLTQTGDASSVNEADISFSHVNSKNVNVTVDQEIDSDTKINLSDLENTETAAKLSNEIAQTTRNEMSGISIGNISSNINSINQTIASINNITQTGIQQCRLSNYNLSTNKFENIKTEENINFSVKQSIKSISQCILGNSTNTTIVEKLDAKMKQIATGKIEGINPTSLLLAGVLGFGVIGLGAVGGGGLLISSLLTTLLGPLLFLGGLGLTVWRISKIKDSMDTSFLWPSNYLEPPEFPIVSDEVHFDESKSAASYGYAELYQVHGTKNNRFIKLFNGGEEFEKWKKIRSLNIDDENIDIKINGFSLIISVKNTDTYPGETVKLNTNEVSKDFKLEKLPIPPKDNKTQIIYGDNTVYWGFDKNTVTIKLWYNKEAGKDTIKYPLKKLQDYTFIPVLISKRRIMTIKSFTSDALFLVGIALIIIGLIFSLFTFMNKKPDEHHHEDEEDTWRDSSHVRELE